MYIQGHLQNVFDALYSIGAIDPVLGMDWDQLCKEMESKQQQVNKACQQINACSGDMNLLVRTLSSLDQKTLSYVAMEVAREFCEFQDRKQVH